MRYHGNHSTTARLMCVVAAGVFMSVGCGPATTVDKKTDAKIAPAPIVSVGTARSQLLENVVQLPATLTGDETAMLMPRVEAYVREVLVDIGDEVAQGQELVILHAPELQQQAEEQWAMIQQLKAEKIMVAAKFNAARSQLDEIHAQLELKRSQRDRLKRLVRSGAIQRQRLEEADFEARSAAAMLARYENEVEVAEAQLAMGESDMEVAQAKFEQAETLASYLVIKAPFAGVIAKRNADPGNLVRPANQGSDARPLLTLAKIDKLRAVVHVTTDIAGDLTVGAPVTFVADELSGQEFESNLSRIAGAYDDRTRMMRAEIDLENPSDALTGNRSLRAGSYGMATIVLKSATLPVVPKSALRTRGGRTSVVVVRGNTCLITPVELAIESEGLVGLSSGISAGDTVVVENPNSYQDEQTIQQSQIKHVAWE